MEYIFNLKGKEIKINIDGKDENLTLKFKDKEHQVRIEKITENCLAVILNGTKTLAYVAEINGEKHIVINGKKFTFRDARSSLKVGYDEKGALKKEPFVSAPMPGKVVKIAVKLGDKVKYKDTLAIVEAMKMEHELVAPMDGEVIAINANPGENVDAGVPIVELKPSQE